MFVEDAGFRAVKMKVGLLRVEHDLQRVAAVRAALGPDLRCDNPVLYTEL